MILSIARRRRPPTIIQALRCTGRYTPIAKGSTGFEAIESDVNIIFENSKNAAALYIFSVTIKNSNVNIEINNKDITDLKSECVGISTVTLLIQNSYVDINIISFSEHRYNVIMSYMIAVIDDFTDRTNTLLSQYIRKISITPEGIEKGVTHIHVNHIYIYDNTHTEDEYYVLDSKTLSGHNTTADGDWNIHYDRVTNTLYLRSFTSQYPLTIYGGSANINIEGENVFGTGEWSAEPAIKCDSAPTITGNGTLTVSSARMNAVECEEGLIFGENVTAKGSLSADGSDAEDYDNAKIGQYKWVQITAGSEEKELSFFEKIAEFFRNIFAKIAEFFGGLFG